MTAGLLALATGAAGVVLPLLPATPFLLLAAFCFARGSPRLHRWLIGHRIFGPPIENWRRHGAIGRNAKISAAAVMAATFAGSALFGASLLVLTIQGVVLSGAALFVLTRPGVPRGDPSRPAQDASPSAERGSS